MNRIESSNPFTKVFFDETDTLRSGWRSLSFISLFVVATLLGGVVVGLLAVVLPLGMTEDSLLGNTIGGGIGLIAALIAGWICLRAFEGLPFRAIGAALTKGWARDLFYGIVVGALTICLAVGFAMIFGGLRFDFNAEAGRTAILLSLSFSLIIFLVGAAFEEALARGYILQTLMRARLTLLGVLITSLFFAVAHIANDNAGLFSSINTALAGIWLAVAYIKTRTLWFAFGLHFIWNWVMGAFFGIEVSGITKLTSAPLLLEMDLGPVWITGGDYGLEGGIACTIALIISTSLIWFSPVLKAQEEMIAMTSPKIKSEIPAAEAV